MFLVFLVHFQQANPLFYLKLISCNLVSKSVFGTKSACANLALKFSVVSYRNLPIMISNFHFSI